MATLCHHSPFSIPIAISLLLLLLLAAIQASSSQLSPSQTKTLLRLQHILEYPPVLAGWANYTDFCNLPPSSSLAVECSGNRITALTIAGDMPNSHVSPKTLSPAFSTDSLFTTLSRLPNLSTLSLVSLGIWGPLSPKVDRFSSLQVLNLSSNYLSGALPAEISTMSTLQSLVLARNSLNGTVPDLYPLSALQELDLGSNHLGPKFPSFGSNLVTIILKNNKFQANIPVSLKSFDQLQRLDLSSNLLAGPVPSFLFSLPSIEYVNLAKNRLTGGIMASISCGDVLGFVDLSDNLLVGALPLCIRSNSSNRIILNSGNCMNSGNSKNQHPNNYCNQGALAAILPPKVPQGMSGGSKSKLGLYLGIAGGIFGGALLLALLLIVVQRKAKERNAPIKIPHKPISRVDSIKIAPRTAADARHMSQAVRIGAIGITPYRTFTFEELEEATNFFDASNLIAEGPQGKIYKGWLPDGTAVVVRCLNLRQKHTAHDPIQFIDNVSKLRHRHLVSILGHCITGQDNANANTTIFLVFESVSNGTLRSHLTEWRKREMLKWPQRVAAVIGVARGIQFLHTAVVPGMVGNDLRIENILLDETLTAKISNYNMPVLSKRKNNKVGLESPFAAIQHPELGSIRSLEQGEKADVYQLGLILLEIITGKSADSQGDLDVLKVKLHKGLADIPAKLKEMTDPAIRSTFAYDSLRTAVEIALNCVSKDHNDRPSIDDVLWNLQYSVQIQDGWASSESLSSTQL